MKCIDYASLYVLYVVLCSFLYSGRVYIYMGVGRGLEVGGQSRDCED